LIGRKAWLFGGEDAFEAFAQFDADFIVGTVAILGRDDKKASGESGFGKSFHPAP